jgi:hypothetical protein
MSAVLVDGNRRLRSDIQEETLVEVECDAQNPADATTSIDLNGFGPRVNPRELSGDE